MPFLSDVSGSRLGIPATSNTTSSSGVWSLNDVSYLTGDNKWVRFEPFTSSGNTYVGWYFGAAAVDNTIGNPLPSLRVTASQYAYRVLSVQNSFLNKTIQFDMRVTSGTVPVGNFFFGVNTSGAGPFFRIDCRSGVGAGIGVANSWTDWTIPSATGTSLNTNTFYTVKIQITNASTVNVFIGGSQVITGQQVLLRGGVIGLHGDRADTSGCNFDNISVVDGIV
jgi:hypothetical protein